MHAVVQDTVTQTRSTSVWTGPLSRRRALALLGLILAAVTLAALPILTYPLGRDQGEFATIGRGLLQGKVPYVDLWNPKPPAVFYVYAAAIRVFGETAMTPRLLDLLIVPPIAACLYWLGTRAANRAVGLWAALVFPVFYFTETFWTLSQNDGIALLPMTLALACALKAGDGDPRAALWGLAAGALTGLAVWFKYPFVLFAAVVAAGYWLARRPGARPGDARVAAAFVVGGLVVIVGGAAYLASIGALGALIESARVTSSYTALGLNAAALAEALRTAVGFRWAQWGLLFVLALLWWPLNRRQSADSGWRVVWLWLAVGALIMLVQAKGYDYHWLPMLPPLALLAASSIERLCRLAPSETGAALARGAAATGLMAVLVAGIWPRALPYLSGREDETAYQARFQAGEFVASESLAVADYLRARVAPGDSLYIWGFRPEIYYLSRLNPPTRFIFQFPLVANWYPPEWQQENVDILWAAMPPYALVAQADYMPWVTGSNEDSNTLLQGYTELNNWLIANYERETQIGNLFLWRRKS